MRFKRRIQMLGHQIEFSVPLRLCGEKRRRGGFTLVEMLVAMALIIFIMAILSQAFVVSLDTFSQLKAIGDMEEGMRTAVTSLRHDLAQPHFEGGRRLSDPDFVTNPPHQGFIELVQRSQLDSGPNYVTEAADVDTTIHPPSPPNPAYAVRSFRAVDHMLYMTVRQRGNQRENFSAAMVPSFIDLNPPSGPWFTPSPLLTASQTAPFTDSQNKATFFDQHVDQLYQQIQIQPQWPPPASMNPLNPFATPWTEVCYFLVQTGSTVEPNNPTSTLGTRLYALYRYQAAVVPNNLFVNGGPMPGTGSAWPKTPIQAVGPAPGSEKPFRDYVNGVNSGFGAPGYGTMSFVPRPDPSNPALQNVLFPSPYDLAQKETDPMLSPEGRNKLRSLDVAPLAPGPVAVPFPQRWMPESLYTPVPVPRPAPFNLVKAGLYTQPYQVPSGSTLLLSNVVSFQVQSIIPHNPGTVAPPSFVNGSFDSAEPASIFGAAAAVSPVTGIISGLRITIRVWDAKTLQTRQVTFIQDM